MIAALISARGGSTRVPRKNIAQICGLPLIAWSIIQAQSAKCIDVVYVTTDDDEIAEVAQNFGAEVIRRPVWENGVTVGIPFLHATNEMERRGVKPDFLYTMLPTSLLRKPDDLDGMAKVFAEIGADTITCAAPLKETCILINKISYRDRYGKDFNTPGELPKSKLFTARNHIFDKKWAYSQLMGGWSLSNANFVIDTWRKSQRLDIELESKPLDTSTLNHYYAVSDWQCFDVDYPEDIEVCSSLFESMILKGRGREVYDEYRS